MPKNAVISVAHALGVEEAKRRLDSKVDWALQNCRQHGFEVSLSEWSGDELTFTAIAMGQSFPGRLAVAADAVTLHLAMPWLLAVFLPVLEPIAQSYGKRLLEA